MAKLSASKSHAAQMSPEISDDEVFENDTVWKPLRTNNGLATEVEQQPLHAVALEFTRPSATTSNQRSCDPGRLLWDTERWDNFVGQNFARNENSKLCSDVIKSESSSSEHFKTPRKTGLAETVTVSSAPTPRELQYRKHQIQLSLGSLGLDRKHSIVDGLLFEIYDRWHYCRHADSYDSDTFTEYSSTSEVFHSRYDSSYETSIEQRHARQFNRSFLETQSVPQLRRHVHELQRSISQASGSLVRQLKRRDRHLARLARHSDVVTAILQAASLKRRIDTRMKFSVTPPAGQTAFDQWKDAMKAVNRLPMGLPQEFRKKVWLSLADHYIRKLKIDWHKTVRLAFNERSNPDDDKLGMQIVKDLHRTGCSSFSGQDNEEDRAVLKRVLLAYARWNKRIGYCQGFNVIAALLLNVMERKEDDALKVMIYLIDHVLPESYFDNNLRALSVDMAVFRDLLRLTMPTLSRHLHRLQHAAQDVNTGACYEPPLTNVFTMQWFLTLFATCLPKEVVLRVWDAILLEGSEVLLRTALCLWGKLARRIMKVDSADEFYSLMGELSSHMMEGTVFNSDDMIKAIYAIAPYPFPQLTELREKYTYNIRPFSSTHTPAPGPGRNGAGGGGISGKASRLAKAVLYSDEDDVDEDDMRAITSFPGMTSPAARGKGTDISVVGPGAYGEDPDLVCGGRDPMYMERMSTDITALRLQYDKLRQRQRQAHVIITAASAKKALEVKPKTQAPVLVPKIESPLAMNHLFVGKVQGGRNRLVTHGPRIIAPSCSQRALTKQLQAVAAAQAASRTKLQSPDRQPPPAAAAKASTIPVPLQHLPANSLTPEPPEASSPTQQAGEDRNTSTSHPEEGSTEGCASEAAVVVVVQGAEESTSSHLSPDQDSSCAEGQEEVCSIEGQCAADDDDDAPCPEPLSVHEHVACGSEEAEHSSCLEDGSIALPPGDEEAELSGLCVQPAGELSLELSQVQAVDTADNNAELDSGIVLSSPSLDGSAKSSPAKRAERPSSIPLSMEGLAHCDGSWSCDRIDAGGRGDTDHTPQGCPALINRCNSAPVGSSSGQLSMMTALAPATTPTMQRLSLSTASTPTAVSPHSPSHSSPGQSWSPVKSCRPFNPFPVKHVNTNRARTGLKLGLYTPSTLEHIQGTLLGGLAARKARNASS